ncbi:MarR family transcriptional regulator [Brooklawnia sp.]|uniref:MarR family winged helix-turn-helix transcriptional regulator n=1 Tax=Brooklawnia sp. TaxID=2699740 RepID=UPI00311DA7E0
MDEVDELVAAWRRERPDLDLEPMQVWSRIARLAQLLSAARATAFEAQDLQIWEFDVLAALRRAGKPYRLAPGQLIAQTHVTSGTMTNRVDRLCARGLVGRMANPQDGRGVLVQLTAEGREKVDAALADLVSTETTMVSGMDEGDQQHLADFLRALLLAAQQ